MDTGYLVSSGLNPYQSYSVVNSIPVPLPAGIIPRIGYPPPWTLLLGAIFRLSYNLIPDLFFYNLATKIPIIVGNLVLAYLTRSILKNLHVSEKKVRFAWLFMLFNPFILLTTSAWGQFDTVVAIFALASLYFLSKKKTDQSAFLMGISICLKPIALGVAPLPLLFPSSIDFRGRIRYALILAGVLLTMWIAPFFALGWSIPIGPNDWNAYSKIAGGMSPFNLVEIFTNSLVIPSNLQLLGYLWLPCLLVGYYLVYNSRMRSFSDIVPAAIGVTLIFFLTRTWLSEPNLNLIIPLVVIAWGLGYLDSRSLHLVWIIPLVFMFLNTSFHQLFFLVYHPVIESLFAFDQQFRVQRLAARFAVTVIWQILAWLIVIRMLYRNRIQQTEVSSLP